MVCGQHTLISFQTIKTLAQISLFIFPTKDSTSTDLHSIYTYLSNFSTNTDSEAMARNPFLLEHIIEAQRKVNRLKKFENSLGNFLKYFSIAAFALLNVMYIFKGRFLIGEIFTPGIFDLTTLVNLVLFSILLYSAYLTRSHKTISASKFAIPNPVTTKYLKLTNPRLLDKIYEATYQGEHIKLDLIKLIDELITTEAVNKELLLRTGLEGLEIKQLLTMLSENFINEDRFFENYNFNELLENAKNLYPHLNATEIDSTVLLFSIMKDLPKEILEKFEVTEETIYGATTWLRARYLKLYFISEIVQNHIKKGFVQVPQHLVSQDIKTANSSCFSCFKNLTQELISEIHKISEVKDNYFYPFTYRFGDLTEIIDNLEDQTSLNLIIGNSQSGKTTLIKSLSLTLLNLQKNDPLKDYEIIELETKQVLREANSINEIVNAIKANCELSHNNNKHKKIILFIDDFGELLKVDDKLTKKILDLFKTYKENTDQVKVIAAMKKHEFDYFKKHQKLDYIFEQINLEPHASSIVNQIMIDKYLHSTDLTSMRNAKLRDDPKPQFINIQDAFKKDTNELAFLQHKYEDNTKQDSKSAFAIILNSQTDQYQDRVSEKITERIFGRSDLIHRLNINQYIHAKDLNKLKQELAAHVTTKPYSTFVIPEVNNIALGSELESFLADILKKGYFEYRSASFREEERINLSHTLIILQTNSLKISPTIKSQVKYIFNLQPLFKLQSNTLIRHLLNEYKESLKEKGLEVIEEEGIKQKLEDKILQLTERRKTNSSNSSDVYTQIKQEINKLINQRIEQKMLTGQLKPGDSIKL